MAVEQSSSWYYDVCTLGIAVTSTAFAARMRMRVVAWCTQVCK